ncbi:uncharacterized protein LOC135072754 [Ostrinia nubilalis]|uniref:uncharacterized protein LOC135072754 n=1 Tax=Ostrinia nubilalis TaxID=29057 RepID=UPI003082608F
MDWRIAVPFCSLLLLGFCGYPPRGEEVLPGSVLLPATRRGRYLANIVKRQAVDGTGIKFNEDADRMNAESKKKVDVLSEELLPYIIAEQERRTTLFRRIMTAIQNGEKGVTVAEVRNKHPLLIRRGLMYRCPSNRAIIEPDGSGIMMCENDVEPSPIMYDSCLSAEDKDVYVARNKFFFCNRHKVEGPDLPKNGSTVIGCAPSERTSLNYTYKKCALEETEDVVVQYRYYPDKTYKFVNDLDPDHEVCDHWNPCQVGYIFSLPSADQALPANELWHDYDPDGYDFNDEFVHRDTESYRASPRRIKGARVKNESFWIECFWKRGSSFTGQNHGTYESDRWYYKDPYYYTELLLRHSGDSSYSIIQRENYNKYHFLTINRTDLVVHEISLNLALGQIGAVHTISFQGKGHRVKHVRVRAKTWQVYNLHPTVCKIKHDDRGAGTIEINLGLMSKKSFGHYFAIVDSPEGVEEKIRIMQVHQADLKSTHVVTSFAVGEPAEATMTYDCPQCQLVNVLCNGADVLDNGHVVPEPPNTIKINYPRQL